MNHSVSESHADLWDQSEPFTLLGNRSAILALTLYRVEFLVMYPKKN